MTGFVFLDKEEGMTSFLAAKKLGRIFGTKKVGHTGTLDPMATGVMVIAVEHSTRFIELISDHDKAYRARFLLGKTTDTLDITGEVLSEREVNVGRDEVEEAVLSFKGDIMQLPPMYSAIKKDGVRLYELARQGIETEREERQVRISSIALTDSAENEYEIEVYCSKGTYIRSLISDIGEKLGTGAVMTSLRRIKANGVTVDSCHTLGDLEKMKEEGTLSKVLVPVDSFIKYPAVRVTAAQAKRFSNGGALDTGRFGGKKEPGYYNVYSPEGKFLGIGEIDEEKTELKVKRVFVG
ncbi:MAG: tRNA pseudouridine(55) synthase TruB [Clostridia bacterium]|nr:tRNA pseudouridine(55) synthase TruB [Clostridia bacterium]